VEPNAVNASYLETKKNKLGHMIGSDEHDISKVLEHLITDNKEQN
jgi:hypothetical protein